MKACKQLIGLLLSRRKMNACKQLIGLFPKSWEPQKKLGKHKPHLEDNPQEHSNGGCRETR